MHKQIKVKPKDTIVLESPRAYFSIEIDKDGFFVYHTEPKNKNLARELYRRLRDISDLIDNPNWLEYENDKEEELILSIQININEAVNRLFEFLNEKSKKKGTLGGV